MALFDALARNTGSFSASAASGSASSSVHIDSADLDDGTVVSATARASSSAPLASNWATMRAARPKKSADRALRLRTCRAISRSSAGEVRSLRIRIAKRCRRYPANVSTCVRSSRAASCIAGAFSTASAESCRSEKVSVIATVPLSRGPRPPTNRRDANGRVAELIGSYRGITSGSAQGLDRVHVEAVG
jgi:hypothetical protein